MDVIEWLAKRRIGFRSLSEGIDSTTSTGMLLFHIVGAIAEFERTLISDRTRAGMASAKSRGASIGRPRKLSAAAVLEAKIALDAGTATLPDLAAALEVAPITLERALKGLDRAA
jgi:DNA invertase Pin-like site-specific DNA recombinase